MKVLVIDNYDSFTYNLVQYLLQLGVEVEVKRNDEVEVDYAKNFDKILISPGPCTPKEAGISVEVIKKFYKEKPILGVCLGHQSIGYAFGGKVVRAKKIMHGKTSFIFHEGKGIFEGIPSPFKAVRYHSLVLDEETLPKEIEITARSEDGEVMALQLKDYPTFGVQFHPESVLSEYGMKILQNFLKV